MRDVRRTGLSVALVTLILDQVSKIWLVGYMAERSMQPKEITPFFDLVMVWNTGVSFGMFAGNDNDYQRWLLILISIVIVAGMAMWLWKRPPAYVAAAIGLVIGGAIGNVVDRLHWGAVADFFSFHVADFYWPAFNIADAGIVIGVVILCWDSIVGQGNQQETGNNT